MKTKQKVECPVGDLVGYPHQFEQGTGMVIPWDVLGHSSDRAEVCLECADIAYRPVIKPTDTGNPDFDWSEYPVDEFKCLICENPVGFYLVGDNGGGWTDYWTDDNNNEVCFECSGREVNS